MRFYARTACFHIQFIDLQCFVIDKQSNVSNTHVLCPFLTQSLRLRSPIEAVNYSFPTICGSTREPLVFIFNLSIYNVLLLTNSQMSVIHMFCAHFSLTL